MSDDLRKVVRDNAFTSHIDEGEIWTIPGTNSSFRFVTDDTTAPFAIVHSRGMPDAPVPPHLHQFAIDTWLVLQGKLHIWAGDEGRSLTAGDFAFVPPGTVHSYQIVEPHTEFIGIIHPSQWIDFFRAIGEVYKEAGPFPSKDTREFPKDNFIKAIRDGHDVVPQFGHKFGQIKHEWQDAEVPNEPGAYFLKAHRGPRYALGGQTCSPMTRIGCSSGKFVINCLEAHTSMAHPSELSTLAFSKSCVALFVQTGAWKLDLQGKSTILNSGDSAYIPPGEKYGLLPHSRFARAYLFGDGPGHEALFESAGVLTSGVVGSESSDLSNEARERLQKTAKQHGITLG